MSTTSTNRPRQIDGEHPADAPIDFWEGDVTDFHHLGLHLNRDGYIPDREAAATAAQLIRESRAVQAAGLLLAAQVLLDETRREQILAALPDLAAAVRARAATNEWIASTQTSYLLGAVATAIRDTPASGDLYRVLEAHLAAVPD